MASIRKKKYNKTIYGKNVKKQSKCYYVWLRDANGVRQSFKLFADKTASEQQAARLQKEIELEKAGVVDRYKQHRKKPLTEHLDDFEQSMLAKGGTAKNAKQIKSRVKRVFDECKFPGF